MKKVLLTSVVAGLFLAGCGENLPNEITSHENFKSCQQVEKNLLTIQSDFEKDDREVFYKKCNLVFNDDKDRDGKLFREIFENKDEFNKVKTEAIKRMDKKAQNINELYDEYYKARNIIDVLNAEIKLPSIEVK